MRWNAHEDFQTRPVYPIGDLPSLAPVPYAACPGATRQGHSKGLRYYADQPIQWVTSSSADRFVSQKDVK
jgi:hypothetical protein